MWPYTYLTTYIAGSPPAIQATDLNFLQKTIISLVSTLGFFGDGSDGDLTVGTGATANLTGNKFYDHVTIGTTATLKPNGWPIIAKTSITMSASDSLINGSGGSGSGSARGLALDGSVGGPHINLCPGSGLGSGSYSFIGQSVYGLGGNGGVGGGSAPSATTVVSPGTAYKTYPWRFCGGAGGVGVQLAGSDGAIVGGRYDSIRGGGAGSPGAVAASSTAGGGGAAGQLVVMIAPTITVNGFLRANGGAGGNAAGANGNGGGGGGGGAFLFVCQQLIDNGATYFALAGSGGSGTGSGSAGASGSAGNTTPYVVTIQPW